MRAALPSAALVGFTGTPVELTDKNTRAIFGDYISVYDIRRAVIDGATSLDLFRFITLPLILPAFFAGLVFAFARHMTSLSAVIFLTTAQWPILTVWILSEVEQGGMSVAAAYSIILIAIVLAAIGLMSLWLKRTYGASQDVDMTVGG